MRTSAVKVRMSRALDFTGFSQNVSRGSLLGWRMARVPEKRDFSGNKENIQYNFEERLMAVGICYLNKLGSGGVLR